MNKKCEKILIEKMEKKYFVAINEEWIIGRLPKTKIQKGIRKQLNSQLAQTNK